MKIKFKHCRRKRIRKFLSGFHGKERTDLYKIFTAIAYLVYTGCQWKMLPRYLMGRKLPSPRPLVGAFLHLFRSRWSPIASSRAKENRSTIDRPAVNIYGRTGSYTNGLWRSSRSIVVGSPCPGYTMVSPGRVRTLWRMPSIN